MVKATLEEFIEKSIEIYNDKFIYSKVNYINNKTKVIITCKLHGDFEQAPNHHIKGYGCPICSGKKNKYWRIY